jgi:hypothetical protein
MKWDSTFPFIALLTAKGKEDRVADFFQDGSRFGMTPKVVRVYTFEKNCFGSNDISTEITRSHGKIMQDALAAGAPYALIFEDDSRFFGNASEANLDNLVSWMQKKAGKWDIVYLGCVHIVPPVPVAKGIRWTAAPLLSHSYVITAPFMQRYLEFVERSKTRPIGIYNTVDFWFARTGLRKFSAHPQLCYQCEIPRNCPIKWGKDFGYMQKASEQALLVWLIFISLLILIGLALGKALKRK